MSALNLFAFVTNSKNFSFFFKWAAKSSKAKSCEAKSSKAGHRIAATASNSFASI
jgi:hypothetical protein